MRDADRIPEVLNTLAPVWQLFPDLRLGQLLWVLAEGDPFYIEDEDLVKRLKARAEKYVEEKRSSNGQPCEVPAGHAECTTEWLMPFLRKDSGEV